MEPGKSKKPPRRYVIAGAIVALIGLVWSSHAVMHGYLGNCRCSNGPTTRSNMHDVQLAVEDFALAHDGRFPGTTAELAPYTSRLRLRNSFTELPLDVVVRQGPLAERDSVCEPGTVVVERPDSANYVICGCMKNGKWMEFQLQHEPVL